MLTFNLITAGKALLGRSVVFKLLFSTSVLCPSCKQMWKPYAASPPPLMFTQVTSETQCLEAMSGEGLIFYALLLDLQRNQLAIV